MKFIYLYLPIYYYLICFTYLIRQAASHARFLKLKKKYNIHWQRDWRLSASWGSTTQYDSAVMFRGVSGKSPQLGGSSWCRETPISRTAVRLIKVVFFSILDDSYSDLLEQMIMHNITNEYYVQNTMHNIMHNIAV